MVARASWLSGVALAALSVVPAEQPSAATFRNLYTVNVVPSPDAANPSVEAGQLAMGRLLTRVTGDREAGLDSELLGLIENAAGYVQAAGPIDPERWTVTFDPQAIAAELTRLNRPIWGPERPLTLLWVAVDAGQGERGILSANEIGSEWSPQTAELLALLREELLAVADERGLPVTFPLLDLEDMNAVGFADIWGGFYDRIERGSERYGADAVLTGRVRVSALGIEVQWTLLNNGRPRMVSSGTVRDGLDRVADLYAAEFAALGGALVTRITVLNVSSLADYGRLMRYMENLSLLDSVHVESFEQDALTLRVAARGEQEVLERTLALGGMLRPFSSGSARDAAAPDMLGGALVFRLAR